MVSIVLNYIVCTLLYDNVCTKLKLHLNVQDDILLGQENNYIE